MKIYFRTSKEHKTLKNLLKDGFSGTNFKKTYYDKEYGTLQCHSALRSFDDLLLISRTYFPRTSEKKLAKTLFELNKETGLIASYCCTIDKLVFNMPMYSIGLKIDADLDERDKNLVGEGTYSFNQIKKLAQSPIKKKNVKC